VSKADEAKTLWRVIVVGGHTRSIGKTQLVCDVIQAFPEVEWIAGKITQYGHGVCAKNGENCDCAPTEHICALDWETRKDTGTDSARFLGAGAKRAFWLRTKQGYLAEGLPLLRKALEEVSGGPATPLRASEWPASAAASASKRVASKVEDARIASEVFQPSEENPTLILESNSVMQFLRPSLYFAVLDPLKEDFKESAQMALDRAHALVMRGTVGGDAPPAPLWMKLPTQLMKERPSVLQREGEELPAPLWALVHQMLEEAPGVRV